VANLGANVNETWFAMAQAFYFSAEYAAFKPQQHGIRDRPLHHVLQSRPRLRRLAFWVGNLDRRHAARGGAGGLHVLHGFASFTNSVFGNTAARAEVNTVVDFYRGCSRGCPTTAASPSGSGASAPRSARARPRSPRGRGDLERVRDQRRIHRARRTNAQYVGDLYNAFLRAAATGRRAVLDRPALHAHTRGDQVEFKNSPEFQARVQAIILQGCLP
jgi:hypothetical protein